MKYKYYIGIDIGKSGAIVIQDQDGRIVDKQTMPKIGTELDIHALNDILLSYPKEDMICAFEDLHAIFGSSAGSTFSFGHICGVTEALVIANHIPFIKVQAKVWQKEAFQGIPEIRKPSKINKNGTEVKGRLDTKAMAEIASKRLFPSVDTRATERSKKVHDGIIDALLISWWIRKNY